MRKLCRLALLSLSLYLGLHNGYLALWSTEASTPEQVFPYRAALFPKLDRQELERGIPISDQEQLQQLLEDLTS